MLHVYEFEVFEDDGWVLAFPYDMDGGTQGADFKDACEAAAEWLQTEMEHRAMHDLPFPEGTFGNEPQHGGKNVVVAVDVGKEGVRSVSPSEAARMLGVTPGRVTQMMDAGRLETFDLNGKRRVAVDSIEARIAENPRAGRPCKAAAGA